MTSLDGRRRSDLLTGGAAVCGLAATLLVSVSPQIHFAYRSVPAHVSLETANALVASVVAYLAYGRLRRSHDRRDILLLAAFALFAVADLFVALLPTVLGNQVPAPAWAWSSLAVRFTAAALFAASGAIRRPQPRGGPTLVGVLITLTLLVGVLSALWALRASLPVPVDPALGPEQSGYPRIAGQPAALALQLVQVLLFAVASVGYLVRGRCSTAPLDRWIGAGAVLGAFARLNYFLFPSIYSQWVYTGDLLRTGFYLLLLAGAASEVRSYWAAQAEAAVFAERRRVAPDLHDGAVQEIGVARMLALRLPRSVAVDADRIASAAERALAEMRAALAALSADPDEPLIATLERAAAEVADRYDVPLHLDLDAAVTVDLREREALVRIVRESVQNAARHGKPDDIRVELHGGSPRQLVVCDDGRGFDRGTLRPGGFGLQSMRDRAEGIGGTLQITSAPAAGTIVEVTW